MIIYNVFGIYYGLVRKTLCIYKGESYHEVIAKAFYDLRRLQKEVI